jgi:hypothetical protein
MSSKKNKNKNKTNIRQVLKVKKARQNEMKRVNQSKIEIIEQLKEGEPINPRVIVSFTTLPDRVNEIEPFLNSLREQIYKPDQIYMNIPRRCKRQDNREYVINPNVMKYETVINFNYIEDDYGPLTKLIGVLHLEIEPETLIITLDDDKVYDKNTIKDIVKYAMRYENSAIGRRGWILRRPEFEWPKFSFLPKACQIREPTLVDVLTGVGGVGYRRKFFGDDFIRMDLIEQCFMVDDIYINGYLAKQRIQRILISSTPNEFMKKHTDHLDKTYIHKSKLWTLNKDGENNNKALRLFKEYFNYLDLSD